MSNEENKCLTCGIDRSEMSEIPWGRFFKDQEGNRVSGIQCKPCRAKEIQNEIDEFQKSDCDTEYEDAPICPECGYKHEPDGERIFYEDGDHEFTCHRCDYEFLLTTNISFTYSTYKKP
jgi:hypothetical protein